MIHPSADVLMSQHPLPPEDEMYRIGTDGSLTGYGGGLWRKRWLLHNEAQLSRTSRTP